MFDIDKQYLECQAVRVKTKTDWSKFRKEYLDSMGLKGIDRKNAHVTLDTVIPELQTGKRHFSTSEDYNKAVDYYKNNREKFDTYTIEMPEEDTVEARNNEILDIQWAVLTNRDTLPKLFNPGSFDNLKQQARVIRALQEIKDIKYEDIRNMSIEELDNMLSSKGHNITDIESQLYYYEQNSIAAKMVGIFANNNVSHAFISLIDVYLNLPTDLNFTFDGINSMNVDNRLDSIKDFEGNYISKNIASYLAASVDAVKDPVLNFINSNPVTVNPAMVLLRLGFSPEAVNMFTSQPVLKKLVREYNNRSDSGYVSIDALVKEFIENREGYKESIAAVSQTQFTKEELAEEIQNNNPDSEFQTRVLGLFGILTKIGAELNELTFITKFNSSNNGVGPSIADTLILQNRAKKFFGKFTAGKDNSNISIFSDNTAYILEDLPILKGFYKGSMDASEKIFSEYFPHYSLEFGAVLDTFINTHSTKITPEIINLLINDYMLYKMTGGKNPVFDFSHEKRKDLVENIVSVYKNMIAKYPDNAFLKILQLNPNEKINRTILEARTGGYSQDTMTEIRNAYSELFNTNPEEAQKLFYYSIMRSGFKFSPTNYSSATSVDVKMTIPGYVDMLSDFSKSDTAFSTSEFLYQFMRNHSNMYNVVPVVKKEAVKKVTNSMGNTSIVFKSKDAVPITPIISYNKKLYSKSSIVNETTITYEEIQPLGYPNQFVEYNMNETSKNMKSVLDGKEVIEVKEDIPQDLGKPKEPVPESSGYKPEELSKEDFDYIFNMVFTNEDKAFIALLAGSNLSDEEKEKKAALRAINTAIEALQNKDNTVKYDINKLNEILDRNNVCR